MAVQLIQPGSGKVLEVADDEAAEFWIERGYLKRESAKPAPAKKAAAKRSASKS